MMCKGCPLMERIGDKRWHLNRLAEERGTVFTEGDILQLSQELDHLIAACLKCQKDSKQRNDCVKAANLLNGK